MWFEPAGKARLLISLVLLSAACAPSARVAEEASPEESVPDPAVEAPQIIQPAVRPGAPESWPGRADAAPMLPGNDVTVRPRNTQGVDVDPLHTPRRVRRNGPPPVNEEPTGRVRQVEEYIMRHAGSPESLRVHHWGRVQPHGDGFTVRVRYSLQGAAGFGLSNEDMIFFMYSDGTVYQRAAYRGN